MELYKLFNDTEKIISIVGMAKNAGKTVTLNYLIEAAMQNQMVLGLTSIGRDGERQDLVTRTDKPMIFVRKGTLVGTAELLFELSEAKMEVLEITPYVSAMGKTIIGRTLEDGYIQLGGPSSNEAIKAVSDRMIALGAAIVLVDGALDRSSSASPAISDACILATGAVVSRDMTKTVAQTAHKVALFGLEMIEEEGLRAAQSQLITVSETGSVTVLSHIKTALNSGRQIAEAIEEDTRYIVFPGALVSKTLIEIVTMTPHFKQITFVVKDATKLFIDYRDWQYFMRIGVQIKVQMPIKLKVITANPYAPSGYYYDNDSFIEALGSHIKDIPIVDVMML